MTTITTSYKELSISERIQLVEDIWDSIAEETSSGMRLSPEGCDELRLRLASHQADPSSSIPWEHVRTALFKHQS